MSLGIVLIAFALRLWGLDQQSIWDDEGSAIFRATRRLADVANMTLRAANAERVDTNPPLYFLLLHGWLDVAGVSATAARLFSVAMGTLAVAATVAMGTLVGNRPLGLVAGLLAAVSPFYVYYAQEARMYGLLLLLLTAYLYTAEKARRGSLRWWLVAAGLGMRLTMRYGPR